MPNNKILHLIPILTKGGAERLCLGFYQKNLLKLKENNN